MSAPAGIKSVFSEMLTQEIFRKSLTRLVSRSGANRVGWGAENFKFE